MKRNYRQRRPIFSSPVPKDVKSPKIKWKILPIFWMGLKRTAMLLGFMMLLSMLVSLFVSYSVLKGSAPQVLPKQMVLFFDLAEGIIEVPEAPHITDPFGGGGVTVHNIVEALDKAAVDPRVKGVYARLSGGSIALSHIQEIRAALARFRASGKFSYIYSPSYGGEGGGFGGYYLASAFEQVWMQPMGVVSIPGINAEVPFARGLLDEIGVEPQFFQRKEYKSAYESFTNTEMSQASEEATKALIEDLRAEIVGDIATGRDMRTSAVEQLVDKALFTADAAVQAGLIDRSDYADVLVDDIKERVTGDAQYEDDLFVTLERYLSDAKPKHKAPSLIEDNLLPAKLRVAIVNVVGAIVSSAAGAGGSMAAADEIAPAIWEAAEDDAIQAIILRIDSPGGSPTASETILRALQRAQDKGKPVIVSMGPTAASGGYWIATSADQIFAMPATLTGSIGVVGGKVSLRELWNMIGVNWEAVRWGENASLWSMNKPFSDSEAAQINAMLDQVYEGFTQRVAKGRNMSPAQVEALARGRVWSGKSAQRIGLVDKLGGLKDAKDYTAELLGVESARNLEFITLPEPLTPLEMFVELLADQGSVMEALRLQGSIAQSLKPALEQIGVYQSQNPAITYEPLRIR
ncbi:MAG: signal peptide peptidase SppA [Alphaproteobacteria bacterium]|nr:signal peptide peptidase SppA [Alphaproteobacteria bacterium]